MKSKKKLFFFLKIRKKLGKFAKIKVISFQSQGNLLSSYHMHDRPGREDLQWDILIPENNSVVNRF